MTCAQDSDCVVIGNTTSCYDACTAIVSVTEKPNVEAAQKEASEKDCAPYTAAGCKVTPPPCAPPRPATCDPQRHVCSG
jgi:hypothetical protein